MPNIQMLELVVRKASEDTNFRNSLMQDSKTAIEQELGRSIPLSNADIVVTDQSNTNNIYINIPANPGSLELTDEQLEAVAGGWTPATPTTLLVVSYLSGQEAGKRW